MSSGISIITINFGTPVLITSFLDSLVKVNGSIPAMEVVIVDNGYPAYGDSRRGINKDRYAFPIKFIQNPNISYSSGVNLGVKNTQYDNLIIANSDIILKDIDLFNKIQDIFNNNPRFGIIGTQLINPDGSWQQSFNFFPSLKENLFSFFFFDLIARAYNHLFIHSGGNNTLLKKVEYIDGAFMIIRRQCFKECMGFNEHYDFYAEDADFCWRARQSGWNVIHVPNIKTVHLRGASSTKKSFALYTKKKYMAKIRFVKDHFSVEIAKKYNKNIKYIAFQRFLLYTYFSFLLPSTNIQRQCQWAIANYMVIKEF